MDGVQLAISGGDEREEPLLDASDCENSRVTEDYVLVDEMTWHGRTISLTNAEVFLFRRAILAPVVLFLNPGNIRLCPPWAPLLLK